MRGVWSAVDNKMDHISKSVLLEKKMNRKIYYDLPFFNNMYSKVTSY